MKSKKYFMTAAVAAVSAIIVTGCIGHGDGKQESESRIAFPLKEKVTLTYWTPFTAELSKTCKTMNDTELYQELSRRTGVELEFIHPPIGQEAERFNLLIASAEKVDIYGYMAYPGGEQKALSDGIIMPLNDKMEQYAPNLTAVLKQNPEWDKSAKTDDGVYYNFPFIHGDRSLCVYEGPMIRQDWLDDLGLGIPHTIAEWETVLLKFKEEKGVEYPFSITLKVLKKDDLIAGAFGVSNNLFLDGGRVQYGPIQPAYKRYLETMKRWYDLGLFDRDFATNDSAAVRSKMTNGKVGITATTAGSGLGAYIKNAAQGTDPDFNLTPIPYPVLNVGEKAMMGQFSVPVEQSCFISPSCASPEIAMSFLDYGYGEDGHMLFNFGLEGVSYTMREGVPVYTEEITHNPQGLTFDGSLVRFSRATYYGPFVQDKRYIDQFYELPQQKEAVGIWADTDVEKHMLPPVSLTAEESERYAELSAAVGRYCDEMYLKFILGQESLDQFDNYVQTAQSMGCDEMVRIQQAAVERYRDR